MATKKKSKKQKQAERKLKKFLLSIVAIFCVFAIYYVAKNVLNLPVDEWLGDVVVVEQTETKQSSAEKPKTQEKKQTQSTVTKKSSSSNVSAEDFVPSETFFMPLCDSENPDHIHRDYVGYSVCYRESYEQAEWAATYLTRDRLVKGADRKDNFRADPEIPTGSATPADYKGTGYDRGHLVPAADLAWSEESMDDSFYMTNMSPQAGSFNRGIWKKLEEQVRDWAEEFGTLYTVSGPILEKDNYKKIGSTKVSVPEYYYKALLAYDDDASWNAIGFILPNESSSEPLLTFAVPINEIEERCNIDFFYEMPDDMEEALESTVDFDYWVIPEDD